MEGEGEAVTYTGIHGPETDRKDGYFEGCLGTSHLDFPPPATVPQHYVISLESVPQILNGLELSSYYLEE